MNVKRFTARTSREALMAVRQAFGDDAVVEAVTVVRGVGPWTAHMLLMFSLGRPDILPVSDYGVRKGAMALYGLPALPSPPELTALAEPWRPWRSVASWYLWRALELAVPE